MIKIVGFLKLACVVLLFLTLTAWPGRAAELMDPMPDFSIRTFDGSTYSRESLKGKPLMLVFWNTWCPICRRELPNISRLADEYAQKGLIVLAINTGTNDSEERARAFWEKNGYTMPVGYDHTSEVGRAFRVLGVPTVFLVNTEGLILYKQSRVPDHMQKRFNFLNKTREDSSPAK